MKILLLSVHTPVTSSRERKFPGTFVPGERKFSIGTFRSWDLKVLDTKSLSFDPGRGNAVTAEDRFHLK